MYTNTGQTRDGVCHAVNTGGGAMRDSYSPIKGKCTWWREAAVHEDVWDTRIREDEKRVQCSCFIEGTAWTTTRGEVPSDCPESRRCRYYIKHL